MFSNNLNRFPITGIKRKLQTEHIILDQTRARNRGNFMVIVDPDYCTLWVRAAFYAFSYHFGQQKSKPELF